MSLQELPARPSLEHLKKQARLLLRKAIQADTAAVGRFVAAGVLKPSSQLKLADALHVVAQEYGFTTWADLKGKVESLSPEPVEALTAAVRANDADLLRQVLVRHPALKSRLNQPLPNFGFDAPALIGAVNHANRAMIDTLLNAGADINARTKWWAGGFGVLDSCGPELASELIHRGAYVDVHAAARLGNFERLKELILNDPSLVHARGGDGQLPLHFAATVEIAAYLLDHGAELDARDIDHESTAAQYGISTWPRRPEVVSYLVSRGAKTDILMASALGDVSLVRHHLDVNAASVRISVSEEDFPKTNPRSGGCIYIFGFGWAKTPHMLAREFGHEEAFQLLMRRSPAWLQWVQACEVEDELLMKEILEQHPNLIQTLTARTSRRIIGAALRNKTRAVHLMLSTGWPADVSGDTGQTPLQWAAWHGNVEMVGDLLSHNSPVDALENEHKKTPLGWALHGSEHGWHRETGDYAKTVEALVAAGAKTPPVNDTLEASEEVLAALRRHRDG